MKNVFVKSRGLGLAGVVLAAWLAGCGGGGGSGSMNSSTTAQPQGTLHVALSDAPACGLAAVNVTVVKVRVNMSSSAGDSDAGWQDLTLNTARKINLLNLTNGALEDLGQIPLPAGQYQQIRLVLAANDNTTPLANSVVPNGAAEVALVTPSAVQTGIKLINQFTVPAGQRFDLMLDFDACKSVVQRGNGVYALKPVVRVIPFALNGIDGFVDPTLLADNLLVTAQQNGAVVGATVPNTQTGEFFVGRLPPGTYDVVITADSRASAVVAGVPVPSTTSTVVVSTNAMPITLPVSTTNSVSGTVTLKPAADVVAFVSAQQTFTAGPTVEIKSTSAGLPGGAYSLTLPNGAPLLAQYGVGTLPLAFNEQTTQAGKYVLVASATGYTSQSANVSLVGSIPLAQNNFTLAP